VAVATSLAARWVACTVALLVLSSAPAAAQVASQGRGQLTFSLGQGAGPVGNIAGDVVNQSRTESGGTLRGFGFRILAGYQFADFLSFEAGVTHTGPLRSRATYLGTDQVVADTSLSAIEADLVGRVPFAPSGRIDLTLGAVRTGLRTTLATVAGTALPLGQQSTVDARRFGVTIGADVEWRLSEETSLIAGYHAYPGVGSRRAVGSANGTMSLIAAGLHFEF
jgi:opacity protein-like surface antigen